MLEQRHATNLDLAFSPDILGEIQKLRKAEIVIFVAPLWWMSVPAILKGWFDRVLAMGVAYDGGKIYEQGLMRGKQAMLVLAAGHPAEFFSAEGKHKASPQQLLHPINHGTLALCGFDVHEPYVALNVMGLNDNGKAQVLADLQFRLDNLVNSPQWLVHY